MKCEWVAYRMVDEAFAYLGIEVKKHTTNIYLENGTIWFFPTFLEARLWTDHPDGKWDWEDSGNRFDQYLLRADYADPDFLPKVIEFYRKPNMSKIITAAQFANREHAQDKRSDGIPYIGHLSRCATRGMLLPEADDEFICALWLHDWPEMRKAPDAFTVLNNLFGSRTAELVREVTNPSEYPEQSDEPREIRKMKDFAHLRDISVDGKKIKLIDRADNVNSARLGSGKKWAARYLNETEDLLNAIGNPHPQLHREVVEAMERLQEWLREDQ